MPSKTRSAGGDASPAPEEGASVVDRPFLVSVEGNVGSGKSTMLDFFKSFDDVQLCPEPVTKWCDLNGHNLLGKLYEDPDRWSFQFQSYVQLTRLQILREPATRKVKVVERSLQNNRYCFLELAKKLGSLCDEEMSVLASWHEWLAESMSLDLDLIVYLRTEPEVSYARMRARDRKEESGAPLSYLQHLHQAYEEWLIKQKFGDLGTPILVLDADMCLDTMREIYQDIREVIRGHAPIPVSASGGRGGIVYYDRIRKEFTREEPGKMEMAVPAASQVAAAVVQKV